MKSVVFYVSGHGFGHSSRTAEVIKALFKLRPEAKVTVKTSAPEWFFREQIPAPFEFIRGEYDTGAVQADSLNLDPLKTLKNYAAFIKGAKRRLHDELEFFRSSRPDLIVGDIPPLAFTVAAQASLPSLAIANFSWDWIYEGYTLTYPDYEHVLDPIREGYRRAGLLLRLPFSGPMPAFPRVRDVPLIARISPRGKTEVRRILSLPADRPVILLSFGGFWLGEEYYRKLTEIKECVWIASERVGGDLPGLTNMDRETMKKAGIGYPDLVRASDVVVTKPGYGILSECLANRAKMLYTSRGHFREYDVLVENARRYLPSRFITQEKLKAGALKEELFELLAAEERFHPLPLSGAEVCARVIAGYL